MDATLHILNEAGAQLDLEEIQIGGQTDAGFRIIGLYEDTQPGDPLTEFVPNHIATLAEKP